MTKSSIKKLAVGLGIFVIVCCLIGIVSSGNKSAPIITPQITNTIIIKTITPLPTNTLMPTNTIEPTFTELPTNTSLPTFTNTAQPTNTATITPLSTRTPKPVIVAPIKPKPIATSVPTDFICNDGTISHALHRQGACSHHGGVKP